MPRLPPSPMLEWKADGTPFDLRHGDVYFTAGDGLEEARGVFLKGCALPGDWAGRGSYTIGETGFGTGLNFLAAWQLWRQTRPSPSSWLHFVSFEACPLSREEAARALSRWGELETLAGGLLAQWPHGAKGVRECVWREDGVRLVLHVGEIAETLPRARLQADAWFLDGFSPARNAAMWAAPIYRQIAERSAEGARAASFTVAGQVRRGLVEAGFAVDKRPGHGRKRERLEARLVARPPRAGDSYALRSPPASARKVAIIGAGIAGATLARRLVDHGCDVTVFERGKGPAGAASGNPLALVMPRLDVGDTPEARLLVDAYLAARAAYRGLPGVSETRVEQMPRHDRERVRFERLLADPPLPASDLEALAGGGLAHKRALIVRPRELVAHLLEGAQLRTDADVVANHDRLEVGQERFDAIILATGMGAADAAPWAGLEARLGQVECATGLPEAPAWALARGHYALSLGQVRLWGATFQPHTGPPQVKPSARLANREALRTLAPDWQVEALRAGPVSRAGVRATTPDRLPLAGPLPDIDTARERFAGLANGQHVDCDAPLVAGIWLATGLGSRGFTFAPWIAGIVTAQLLGEPAPASQEALERVSPMRFVRRGLQRRTL